MHYWLLQKVCLRHAKYFLPQVNGSLFWQSLFRHSNCQYWQEVIMFRLKYETKSPAKWCINLNALKENHVLSFFNCYACCHFTWILSSPYDITIVKTDRGTKRHFFVKGVQPPNSSSKMDVILVPLIFVDLSLSGKQALWFFLADIPPVFLVVL